jgi:O-antigen/teichoic acid export membrane protein
LSSEAIEGHSPARNTVFATGTLIVSALFTAGLTLFLVRRLGPAGYGVFSLAVSVGALVALPSDLGLTSSTARFVAENLHSRQTVADVMLSGLRLRVLAGLLACGALFLLAGPIADAYSTPSLATPIQLTAIAVFAQGLGAFMLGLFEAMRRVSVGFRYTLVESSVEASTSVVLVLLGAGAAGAAGGRAIGFATALVLAVVLTVRLLGPATIVRGLGAHGVHLRRIARYGAALLVIDGAITLFNRMDVLIIGAYKGTAAAGTFEAALRLVTFLQYGGLALTPGFAPRLARGKAGVADADSFWKAVRVVILLQLLLLAGMVVWAEPITTAVFGSEFTGSAEIFRALGPYMVLAGVAPLLTIGVNYLGEARKRVPLAIAAVLVNLVIDLLLVPRIGAVAGAIGSAAAFAIYVPGHLWICRHEVGMPDSEIAATTLRGLLACAAASAVLFAFGTSELTVAEWIGGSICAPLAFLGVLLATGELRMGQLRWLLRTGIAKLRDRNSSEPGESA